MKTRILSGFVWILSSAAAVAAVEPSQMREALPKKTESYLKEGMVSGGAREIHSGIVKDIRRATNGGFERIVVDIDAEKSPYYQVAIDPTRRRILVTLFGSPKLAFNAKKIVEQFQRSPLVSRVEFFPLIEDDSWTFAFYLKAAVPVEVFELSAPTRIIFDLKAGAAVLEELRPKEKRQVSVRTEKKAVSNIRTTRVKTAPSKPTVIHSNPNEDDYEGNGAVNHSDDIPE